MCSGAVRTGGEWGRSPSTCRLVLGILLIRQFGRCHDIDDPRSPALLVSSAACRWRRRAGADRVAVESGDQQHVVVSARPGLCV